ncbi:MAG: CDP-alcohol phosphatidyltransferase family protein [Syntrophales bacterium]|jgi:cardiolipin synthase|nr:CDP-alcohol phosphatidyltransferase family protein [Syntrophales bacterium]MCK9527807.1 CDP-alcohol phosphatidyltransferase family protein [Syntrophales bacterium]MDX9922096.1 CDP-alcohol phosphatidyltransferase family protein [Syntrophales bacterium]
MNIPNTLTLFRIILVPVVIILLIQGFFAAALVVFALAGITDGLDGFLARHLDQRTELGSYLDPLADKALLISSFVVLALLGVLPGWLTVIVISRDCIIFFGIVILFLMAVPFDMKPTLVSKVTTFLQIATVLAALVLLSMPDITAPLLTSVLFWVTAAFTGVSGLHYIGLAIGYINRKGLSPPQSRLDKPHR